MEELDTTTFLLQIVNFLVLVWILQRFLYKPVRETIARRQAAVEQTITQARSLETEAASLRLRYENRLADWEQEKAEAWKQLKDEIAQARERALTGINAELAGEREKAQAVESRRRADAMRECEQVCLAQGARFVSRLLRELAGADTEARLLRLALERLDTLPESTVDNIRLACESASEEAAVVTAFPLPQSDREQLRQRLDQLLGMPIDCQFREDPSLLAGLSVTLGPWVFQANLRDEFAAFVDSTHDTA